MGRIPTLTPRKVLRLLEQHGFVRCRQTGSHVVLQHPVTLRRAVVPVHSRGIPRGTLLAILKQAGIDVSGS